MSERCACVFDSRIKRHGRYTLAALCQYKVPPWFEVLARDHYTLIMVLFSGEEEGEKHK